MHRQNPWRGVVPVRVPDDFAITTSRLAARDYIIGGVEAVRH